MRPDCARCAALCCIVFAFDRSEWFGLSKPAGVPCANLDAGHSCTIHGHLAEHGFKGCVSYDCYGAGQRVVQELFDGRSWRDEPALLPAMADSFRAMRLVHELLLLLGAAEKLPLSVEQELALAVFRRSLQPPEGWTLASLAIFERSDIESKTRAFLRSLRPALERASVSSSAAVTQTG